MGRALLLLLLLLGTAAAAAAPSAFRVASPYVYLAPLFPQSKLLLLDANLTLDTDNGYFLLALSTLFSAQGSAPVTLPIATLRGNLTFSQPGLMMFAFPSTDAAYCAQAATSAPSLCPALQEYVNGPFYFGAAPLSGATNTLVLEAGTTYIDPVTNKPANFLFAAQPVTFSCATGAGTCVDLHTLVPAAPLPANASFTNIVVNTLNATSGVYDAGVRVVRAVNCLGADCAVADGVLSVNMSATGGVSSVTGTANQIVTNSSTGDVRLSLPSQIIGVTSFSDGTTNWLNLPSSTSSSSCLSYGPANVASLGGGGFLLVNGIGGGPPTITPCVGASSNRFAIVMDINNQRLYWGKTTGAWKGALSSCASGCTAALDGSITTAIGSLSGTANQITVSNVSNAYTASLPSDVIIGNSVVIQGAGALGAKYVTSPDPSFPVYANGSTAGLFTRIDASSTYPSISAESGNVYVKAMGSTLDSLNLACNGGSCITRLLVGGGGGFECSGTSCTARSPTTALSFPTYLQSGVQVVDTLSCSGLTTCTKSGGTYTIATAAPAPSGVTSMTGTPNQITVNASSGAVQVSLPADVVIANSLTITSGGVGASFISSPLTSLVAYANGSIVTQFFRSDNSATYPYVGISSGEVAYGAAGTALASQSLTCTGAGCAVRLLTSTNNGFECVDNTCYTRPGTTQLSSPIFLQNSVQVIDTLTAGSGISITGSGNSRTITATGASSPPGLPSISLGAGAGTGGPLAVTITGTNAAAFTVQLTTGSSAPGISTPIMTFTFPSGSWWICTKADYDVNLDPLLGAVTSGSTVIVASNNPGLSASTIYVFNFLCNERTSPF